MIWNLNTHKGFTPPSKGIWQWSVLNNTKPTNLEGENEYWHARSTFYYHVNQISLPNQWWRSIHHQVNNLDPETCDNQKKFNHYMIGKGMFLIVTNTIYDGMILVVTQLATKFFWSLQAWQWKNFDCCMLGDWNFSTATSFMVTQMGPMMVQNNLRR
jgi:hypothetical protein